MNKRKIKHLRCVEATLLKKLFAPFYKYYTSHTSANRYQAYKFVVNILISFLIHLHVKLLKLVLMDWR
ncbi:hypothetical protein HanRHA438_Chr14g0634151 [Helianthus annuus]|nr:hypothetical protein HanRHA438_Chr14g0634151 [Helianthus annuus]